MTGLIHLYHGEGKGKTSAAIGLAVRAAGNNLKVIFVQFLKGSSTGEIGILNNIDNITVIRNTKDFGFIKNMNPSEIATLTKSHNNNLYHAIDLIKKGNYDVLILDEICAAYQSNVIDKSVIDSLIKNKPASLELVLTGRNPAPVFIKNADYITEMKCERHPYLSDNIAARRGIEY